MKTQTFLLLGLWLSCAYGISGCKQEPTTVIPQQLVSSTQATPVEEASLLPDSDDVTQQVYVCQSSSAKKYHLKESCHALKRCKHAVEAMKQKDAENIGLGLCGFED